MPPSFLPHSVADRLLRNLSNGFFDGARPRTRALCAPPLLLITRQLVRNHSHGMLVPCSTCGRCGQVFRRRCSCLRFRNLAIRYRKTASPRKLVSAFLSFAVWLSAANIALRVRRAPHPLGARIPSASAKLNSSHPSLSLPVRPRHSLLATLE